MALPKSFAATRACASSGTPATRARPQPAIRVSSRSHGLIYLMDADCVVQPGTIEALVRHLLSDPRHGVVSGSYLSAASKSNLANRVYDVAERYRDYAPVKDGT